MKMYQWAFTTKLVIIKSSPAKFIVPGKPIFANVKNKAKLDKLG